MAGADAGRTAVRRPEDLAGAPAAEGVRRSVLIASDAESSLSLEAIEVAPGAQAVVGEPGGDDLLGYVVRGSARGATELVADADRVGAGRADLGPGDAALWRAGEASAPLRAGSDGLRMLVARAAPGCDEHAPLGERVRVARGDGADAEAATGGRGFRVLLGPENGCCRATMFVGRVPPGAAPWHFHQYDELVCILQGRGTYHQATGSTDTGPGCAMRIPPRWVHINENAGPEPMLVLGVFTPAGSPAAAYLASDPRPG